jgi:hypothetical protein
MMRAEIRTLEKTTRPRRTDVPAMAVLLVLALGISLFLSAAIQTGRYSILRHDFRVEWYVFVLWAAAFALLWAAWRAEGRRQAGRSGADPDQAAPRGTASWLPLAALLISPFLLRFYWTQADLRVRLRVLALLVIAAVTVLKLSDRGRPAGSPPSVLTRWTDGFGSLSGPRRLAALFLASYLVYQLAGFVLVARGATFTGDEPFYLMTTTSLYKDGDINIANNYAREDYFSFYSREDFPRLKLGIYGREGRRGKDHIYPINLPGISVLMLPFYWLSRFFSGRWLTFFIKTGLSVWASLLGLQLYLYARERWENERLSLGLWALYSFSAPVLFYAVHLYPEVPVAFLMLVVFRKITGRRPLSPLSLIGCGVLLGLLPWLGLKFSFFFWPLFLMSIYFLFKDHRAGARIAAFALPALASMALFYLFVHDLYGTFSPIAIYEGVMTPGRAEAFKQTLLEIPLRARIDTLLDYFLDQRDGLLLYSPVYFLVFLGFVEIWRHRRRDFWCFLIVALPFLLNYALFTHRQGASPQGRVLAPLSWIGAVALGEFLVHNRRRAFNWLFGGAALAGLAAAALLLANPAFLYQPTTHEYTSRPGDLFVYLSNSRFFLPSLLPSFIKVDNTRYWPNYIWVAAVVALVAIYAVSRGQKSPGRGVRHLAVWAALAAGVFLWVLYPRTVLFPVRAIEYSPQRALGFTAYPTAKGVIAKDNGDIYLHVEKPYTLLFSSRSPFEKLRLVFGSDKGEYKIRLRQFDLPLLETVTSPGPREITFEPKAFRRVRDLYVYEFGIGLEKLSTESMQLNPFRFQVTPLRK